MTDKDTSKSKGTLSLGGTLSANRNSGGNSGVAVEVRRRRFDTDAVDTSAAASGDSELQRRLAALQQARQASNDGQDQRAKDREQAAKLREEQAKKQAEVKRREEEETKRREAEAAEREIARQKAAADAERAAQQQKSTQHSKSSHSPSNDHNRKTLTVDNNSGGKGNNRSGGRDDKKRGGRNAYLVELEQRARTRPGGGRRDRRPRHGEGETTAKPQEKVIREVTIPEFITVQELASRMAEKAGEVVKKMMLMGQMVTVTQTIDQETAALVVEEMGHTYKLEVENAVEENLVEEDDNEADLQDRPPVVTVMGHVDHGKTTLLDALRSTDVAGGEAGGITQHIGAYQVKTKAGNKITFLDTPGHEAFTAMRARGAEVTDVVVLVVAADDSVMPQTIEAIKHAQAAKVPIVVAINKADKPEANVDKVKQDLLSHDVILEDFGGDIVSQPVSALKRQGLEELEDLILLQAEMLDLKANPNRRADGFIVEAKLEKGRGVVASMIVQRGTIKVGDILVAGPVWGRVRALMNDKGERVESAGPAEPVELLGLQGVPTAGDNIVVVEDEKRAREVADFREQKLREQQHAARRTSLENVFDRMKAGDVEELPIIIKADVQGSIEAIVHGLNKLSNDEVKVNVIHNAVGVVTETDVNLATASGALIIGFNVRADASARTMAEHEGVEIRYYNIIYNLLDDVKAALGGLLSPDFEEETTGQAEVRQIFTFKKLKIAGCMVTDGLIKRDSKARLLRDGKVIHDGLVGSLQREKDSAKEVRGGYECGITLENFDDIKEGDIIEAYEIKEIQKTLDDLKAAAEKEPKADTAA